MLKHQFHVETAIVKLATAFVVVLINCVIHLEGISHCSTVKSHHDQGSSKRKHLIVGLLTVSGV